MKYIFSVVCRSSTETHSLTLCKVLLIVPNSKTGQTSCINLASEYNLKTLGYLSQASLLINLGILDLYNKKAINDNFSELNNLKNILLPNTMGELFKALILSKDINQDLLSTKEFNQLEKL